MTLQTSNGCLTRGGVNVKQPPQLLMNSEQDSLGAAVLCTLSALCCFTKQQKPQTKTPTQQQNQKTPQTTHTK